jgi:ATP-dependent RNA helicase RhlE
MGFETFELREALRRGLTREGFETPTPIQAQAIQPALEGRDVLGVAQTGTGKTAAFLLPSMQRLLTGAGANPGAEADRASGAPHQDGGRPRQTGGRGPRMVVLAPTRELALQITEDARHLSHFTDLRTAVIYGGAPMGTQTEQLRKGVDLIIATPGRLLDHLNRRNVRFDAVEILVLDEADRMLDMGFLPDIDTLVLRMPTDRQTLLFSATMPGPIQSLAYRFMRNPVRVEIENARPPETIHQQIYAVPTHLKLRLLIELLHKEAVESALVFTRTKQDADVVARKLREAGYTLAVMHGDFRQKDRVQALEQFRSGKANILVATNIAARGLDIEGISHVINFDVPDEAENYVHRIGRTARVHALGVAWTLVTPEDEGLIAAIEYLLRKKIERVRLPGFDYDVPTPDWAKPSAQSIRRNVGRTQSVRNRWKALTR